MAELRTLTLEAIMFYVIAFASFLLQAAGTPASKIGGTTVTNNTAPAGTTSKTLDRLDQRSTSLDGKYIHKFSGQGVTVYLFDGGIEVSHPEIAGKIRKGYKSKPEQGYVCNDHGTAMASIIAGQTVGVAPGVTVVDVKVFDCLTQRLYLPKFLEAIAWVIKDSLRKGRAVASWPFASYGDYSFVLDSGVAMLHNAGIPVVVSAGNKDVDACMVQPGNTLHTVAVGSTTLIQMGESFYDTRSASTAWGQCVNIYAPGESAMSASFSPVNDEPIFRMWSGTSMSAGYVSGALALLLEQYPNVSPDVARAILLDNALRNVVRDTKTVRNLFLYIPPEGFTRHP